MIIPNDGERDIELYPYPEIGGMELSVVYSLLSGSWENDLFGSEN